jgi:hypothetical protein
VQDPGLGQQFVQRQPRRVVDLGEDGDVAGAVARRALPAAAAEEFRQVAQVLRAALHRHAELPGEGVKVAAAQARQQHPVHARRRRQVAPDPGGRRQRDHGDGQHRDGEVEPGLRRHLRQHPPQRGLGQLTGHEQQVRPGHGRGQESGVTGTGAAITV